jgi:hypothetical protein
LLNSRPLCVRARRKASFDLHREGSERSIRFKDIGLALDDARRDEDVAAAPASVDTFAKVAALFADCGWHRADEVEVGSPSRSRYLISLREIEIANAAAGLVGVGVDDG